MHDYFETIQDFSHAYLFLGDQEKNKEALFAILKNKKINIENNPDLSIENYVTVSIDDARNLKTRASTKGILGNRFFIIIADAFQREAEQSLLKLFEEINDAYFFVLMPAHANLLDTFLSRFIVFKDEADFAKGYVAPKEIEIFLKSSVAERMKLIATMTDKKNEEDEDNASAIIRNRAHAFVVALMKEMRQSREATAKWEDLAYISKCEEMLRDRGALPKMILESIAMTVK